MPSVPTSTVQHTFNTKKATRALQQGLTQGQVAQAVGVSRYTINKFAQTLELEKGNVEQYRTLRASGLTTIQSLANARVLEILEDEDLFKNIQAGEKLRALDPLMRTLGIAYDKERLELGKSTANIGLSSLVKHVHESTLFTAEELQGPQCTNDSPLHIDNAPKNNE